MNVFQALFITTLVLTTSVKGQSNPGALASLVESERSFAKTCQEKGIRTAFLEFFAPDGIAFFPKPTVYKEAVKGRPAPDPHAVTLQWEPQAGDVASSGDLGYTTGPSVRTDNKSEGYPKYHGQFFSVWKKQPDGSWRVAVDIGTSTPIATSQLGSPFMGSRPLTHDVAKSVESNGTVNKDLKQLDIEFSESCAAHGMLQSYMVRVDKDVRLHRDNEVPRVGENALRKYIGQRNWTVSWTPIASDVSAANDLGYTYGSYSVNSETGGRDTLEKGYYLHVWKRVAAGSWKLVADIANPAKGE
jgi:ketosteroid isomerase-like protein